MSRQTALDALEHETLSQVFRYRVGVADEFAKLSAYSKTNRRPEDVLDALDTEHGCVKRIPLFGPRYCYQLAPRFAEDFASDFDTTRPLKEIEKLRAYAMLRFCLADAKVKRQALNALDFEDNFHDLFHAVIGSNRNLRRFRDYYLAPPRLGFLRVDSALEGAWNRIVLKCRRDLQKHRSIPAYEELIDSGHFELAVVTTFESKAKRVREELDERSSIGGIPIRVLAVPELVEFLAPPPLCT